MITLLQQWKLSRLVIALVALNVVAVTFTSFVIFLPIDNWFITLTVSTVLFTFYMLFWLGAIFKARRQRSTAFFVSASVYWLVCLFGGIIFTLFAGSVDVMNAHLMFTLATSSIYYPLLATGIFQLMQGVLAVGLAATLFQWFKMYQATKEQK